MAQEKVLDLGSGELDVRYAIGNDRTFSLTITDKLTGLPKDLTGYTFSAGIVSPAISFTVTNTVPLTGVIQVTIASTATVALLLGGRYRWYLKYTLLTKVRTYLEGWFFVV